MVFWDWMMMEINPNITTLAVEGATLENVLDKLPNLDNLYLGSECDICEEDWVRVKKSGITFNRLNFLYIHSHEKLLLRHCSMIFKNVESLYLNFDFWQSIVCEFVRQKRLFCFPSLHNLAIGIKPQLVPRFLETFSQTSCWPRTLKSLRLDFELSRTIKGVDIFRIIENLQKLPDHIKQIEFKNVVVREGRYEKRVLSRPLFVSSRRHFLSEFFSDGLAEFFLDFSD
jgi:hypothetical protein